MTRVLVTGGAGFIGSHLAAALSQKKYQVRVLDNLSFGHRDWVPNDAEFIEGDITELSTCQQACRGMDAVFHCAAMSRAAPSLSEIDACTKINILGTQNILMSARDSKIQKVIYSASSTYYGNQPTPHQEYDTPSEFLNFYALSKHVGEQYCLLFDELFDLPCIILRYFNVYGPRQPMSGAYALVLGVFLRRFHQHKTLEIHGTGAQRRDFIHVRDVVRANILALESPCRHEIFNIGSGTNISIKSLAELISANQVHLPRRKGDAEATLADITRAKLQLGWEPSISIEEGIRELLKILL